MTIDFHYGYDQPPEAGRNWSGPSLHISVPYGNIKPCILIELLVNKHGKKKGPIHEGHLQFHLTSTRDFNNHIINLQINAVQDPNKSNPDQGQGGWYGYFDIEFETMGGIGVNLYPNENEMDDTTKLLLQELRSLTTTSIAKSESQTPRKVHLYARIHPHTVTMGGMDDASAVAAPVVAPGMTPLTGNMQTKFSGVAQQYVEEVYLCKMDVEEQEAGRLIFCIMRGLRG